MVARKDDPEANRERDIRAIGEAVVKAGAAFIILWEGLSGLASGIVDASKAEADRTRGAS